MLQKLDVHIIYTEVKSMICVHQIHYLKLVNMPVIRIWNINTIKHAVKLWKHSKIFI